MQKKYDYQLCIAPMMDYTDRHARFLMRLISKNARLYTEMITAQAIIRGDAERLLAYDTSEHPLALQLGGSDPIVLKYAAEIGEKMGYDEVNLNVGCPSNRVQTGKFGACLMLDPALVADCVASMQANIKIPVTVKCRIGVDTNDSYEWLSNFMRIVASSGCETFILHARKAWLSGLSPKENRDIPPLNYDVVRQIKRDFPALTIVINGGIKTPHEVSMHLAEVDGVMIGRAAYHNLFLLAELQNLLFDHKMHLERHEIIELFIPYVQDQVRKGVRLSSITRHILGLYHGQVGGGYWRRYLSENIKNATPKILSDALLAITDITRGKHAQFD